MGREMMNYIFDITLNFFPYNVYAHEWLEDDEYTYMKKIKIYHVPLRFYNVVLNNRVEVKVLSEKTVLLASLNGSIALAFDKDGKEIKRSFLEYQDDAAILDILYTLKEVKFDYVVLGNVGYERDRYEKNVRNYIKGKLNRYEENKESSKLKYIYAEWFQKLPEENYLEVMKESLRSIGSEEERIYNLLNLSIF